MRQRTTRHDTAAAVPPRWVLITFVVLGAALVVACGIAAARLTLFWDDYEYILMQIKSPLSSTFMGSNSHNGPLSMVALRVAWQVFGLWYPGYAMTNAALAVASTGMLLWAVWERLSSRPWIALVGAGVYLTSVGLLAGTLIAIYLEWFVALTFAAGSALAVSRGRHWAVWGGLLAASALSMSGTFPVNALIVASVYLLCRWPSDSPTAGSTRRPLVVAGTLVVLGVIGGALGSVFTRLYPMEYYQSITAGTGAVPVPPSITDAALTTVSLFTSWTASPLFVVALTSVTVLRTLTIFVSAHLFLTFVGLFAAVAVLVLMVRFMARAEGLRRAIDRVLPLTMLLPALGWAVLLAIARGGAPFNVRYQMVWLLPVVLAYCMVIAAPSRSQAFRALQWGVAILMTGSAIVGVVRLPASLESAANEDKPRWEMSSLQRERALACADPDAALPTPVDDISPGLPGDDFCFVVNHLRSNSISGRLFGIDS